MTREELEDVAGYLARARVIDVADYEIEQVYTGLHPWEALGSLGCDEDSYTLPHIAAEHDVLWAWGCREARLCYYALHDTIVLLDPSRRDELDALIAEARDIASR